MKRFNFEISQHLLLEANSRIKGALYKIFDFRQLIYFTITVMRNSLLVHFTLRCSKIELELNKGSKLLTQFFINEI